MMKPLNKLNVSLGRWLGIPVTLHWSWVAMIVVLLFINPVMSVVVVGVFFIVLLHEFGHCIAAQKYNLPVESIVLYPIGGAASVQVSLDAISELVVALAGPFVNVLLIAPLYLVRDVHWYLEMMFFYNLILLVFNMIPAFPMDGGRVLRSGLNWFWGDHYRATLWAVRIGQFISVLFGFLGIMTGNYMLVAIVVFVCFAAQNELEVSRFKNGLRRIGNTLGENREEIGEVADESLRMIENIQRSIGDIDRRYGN